MRFATTESQKSKLLRAQQPMNKENRPLIVDEPVEFEK
jgi:hypothetical protein